MLGDAKSRGMASPQFPLLVSILHAARAHPAVAPRCEIERCQNAAWMSVCGHINGQIIISLLPIALEEAQSTGIFRGWRGACI